MEETGSGKADRDRPLWWLLGAVLTHCARLNRDPDRDRVATSPRQLLCGPPPRSNAAPPPPSARIGAAAAAARRHWLGPLARRCRYSAGRGRGAARAGLRRCPGPAARAPLRTSARRSASAGVVKGLRLGYSLGYPSHSPC